jgi:DNA-directed RNA polymerase specialized sigma subunit
VEIAEEQHLVEEIRTAPDSAAADQARERLMKEHARLVDGLAKKHARRLRRSVEQPRDARVADNFGDLVNAGWRGFFEAVENFNGTNGARLWTYVKREVEGRIKDEVQAIGAPDWITEDARAKLGHRGRARQRLVAEGNLEPTRDDLAAEMQVDRSTLDALDGMRARVENLDAPLVMKYDSDPYGDPPPRSHNELIPNGQQPDGWSETVPDPDADNLPDGLGDRELVGRLMSILDDREHRVTIRAYWQDWSDGRIGREESRPVTKQAIAKVHNAALQKMKLEAEVRGIAPTDYKDYHTLPETAIRAFARRWVDTARDYIKKAIKAYAPRR